MQYHILASNFYSRKRQKAQFRGNVFTKVRKSTDQIVENNTLLKVFLHYAVSDINKIINLPIHSGLWLTVYLPGK